jgi:hypothetical protein
MEWFQFSGVAEGLITIVADVQLRGGDGGDQRKGERATQQ